jgi:DNA repair exonuclease SbcCD ATPase subunit
VEYEKAAERLKALKEEYAVTLAGMRAKFQDNLRRLAEEKDAWLREEKARLRERLKQIVAEYAEARSRLSELEAELGFLLSRATSLATG